MAYLLIKPWACRRLRVRQAGSCKVSDHLGIVIEDLRRSAGLYAHILAPLGLKIVEKHRTGPVKAGS